ncbi:Crp/Fnr family transcriptional regulator [uncultured Muribaculum sp.]|uniref:Crp/Fnr family transcriptional regulator n=1 Tax=uncultured Muribaculum sp. TaxID=1918613 RepID=UPI0026774C7A|nr:Crp/Fnr family transcriptional regulator [uncultured Muribaculum sp.]
MARFNNFYESINSSILRDYCLEYGNVNAYDKGAYFLHEGDVGKLLGFVSEGYFKYTAIDSKGVESVVGFVFEGECVVDFANSVAFRRKSNVSIVAGCQASVFEVPVVEFRDFVMKEHPSFINDTSAVLFAEGYKRYLDIYRKTPTERYIDLINEHPDIVNMVTLRDLASYLMITPVYLSKIRKKVGR